MFSKKSTSTIALVILTFLFTTVNCTSSKTDPVPVSQDKDITLTLSDKDKVEVTYNGRVGDILKMYSPRLKIDKPTQIIISELNSDLKLIKVKQVPGADSDTMVVTLLKAGTENLTLTWRSKAQIIEEDINGDGVKDKVNYKAQTLTAAIKVVIAPAPVASPNKPPSSPILITPGNASTNNKIALGEAEWSWKKATDPEGDDLTYDLRVWKTDNSVVVNPKGLTAKGDTVKYALAAPFNKLEENTAYNWKVIAKDTKGDSTESKTWTYTTLRLASSNAPSPLVYVQPRDGGTFIFRETLVWKASTAPDGKPVKYNVYWGKNNPPTNRLASDLTVLRYDITKFDYKTKYYWQIEAVSSTGEVTKGGIRSYTTGDPPAPFPPAPRQIARTDISVTLSWDAVLGATNYFIDVASRLNPNFFVTLPSYNNRDLGTATSVTLAGLSLAELYHVRMRTKTLAGTSVSSKTITVETGWRPPVSLTKSDSTNNTFKFRWVNDNPGRNQYVYVDVSTDRTFATNLVPGYSDRNIFSAGGSAEHTVTGLTPNTKYYFRVSFGTNPSGVRRSVYRLDSVMTKPGGLGVPVVEAPSSITASGFTANWKSLPGAVSYEIVLSTGSSGLNIIQTKTSMTTSFTFTGLESNRVYSYRVRAKDASNNFTPYSNTNMVLRTAN